MKIAILGYAGQGQSAFEYWNRDGNELTICDNNPDLEVPEGASARLGAAYLQGLDDFDMLVRTPALHPRDIVAANPDDPDILDKVTTNTNEFFLACPSRNIIGVTGTKGKGTTSTLIAKMLETAGLRVHLGGNIGIPPLELLKDDIQPDDWVVLELANFQLIDLKHSPHIAVCLMVVPEHLDWHTDMSEYMRAKQQLFIHQQADDIAIHYAENENSRHIAQASPGVQIPYMQEPGASVKDASIFMGSERLCGTDELKLLGKHNWQNVCAAVTAVWQVTRDTNAMKHVLSSFAGLPFRIEFRAEKNGIRYYNDSFATAPGAAMAAMASVPGKKVMIMGGYERGLDLSELVDAVKAADIRNVLIIGASGERLATALKDGGFNAYEMCESKDMTTIVQRATDLAEPGDAVVLSPAFASFDMFKNFEERGKRFNEAVESV